jgi:hypothetical protein
MAKEAEKAKEAEEAESKEQGAESIEHRAVRRQIFISTI